MCFDSERGFVVVDDFKWWFQQIDVKERTIKGVQIKAAKSPNLGPKSNLGAKFNDGKVRSRLTELSYHGKGGLSKERMLNSLGVKNRAVDSDRDDMAGKIEIAKVVKLVVEQLKRIDLLDPVLEEQLIEHFPELLL